MEALLTQREIDALVASSPEEQPEPERYDFRHPEKLSKEQLRGLQNVQQLVGGSLGAALSSRLHSLVDTNFSAMERGLADQYAEQLGAHGFVSVVELAPLRGICLAGLDATFALIALERMLGGSGSPRQSSLKRDLSELELSVLRHVGRDMANSLTEPWQRITQLSPEISDVLPISQIGQILPPSTPVVSAWYEVRCLGLTGGASFCFPVDLLEQVDGKLAGPTQYVGTKTGDNDDVVTPDHLFPMQVTIRGVLGNAKLTAYDIASLAPGDVIELDQRVLDPLLVGIGDVPAFRGEAGTRGKHMAIQVTELLADEESKASKATMAPSAKDVDI